MRRARTQGGFTVVEMLVAMMVLSIVAVGAMTFIEVVMRQSRGVIDRTDAAQRGRLVLDQMTRAIRSQVCLSATTKGIVAATPNSLEFYADLSPGGTSPIKRKLEYQASTKSIVEHLYRADGTTLDRRTVLLHNVVPAPDPDLPSKSAPTLFNYWAYRQPAPAGELNWLGDSFAASQVPRIAVITVNVGVHPHGATDSKAMTSLNDRVVLRNANPNAVNNDPTCQ